MRSPGVHIFFLALLILATLTLFVVHRRAPAAKPPPGIAVRQDVVFGHGGTHDLHADIAWPQNSTGLLPAVIFIHGGGWIAGSYKQSPVVQLAQNGYFAASIEYRLSNVAPWPAQIEDCKLAVRWLRANAAQFHIDPDRIGVAGESAGGHLVACLGTMAGEKEYEGDGGYPGVSSAVQAVVDLYGPTDFVQIALDIASNQKPVRIDLLDRLLGATYDQNPGLWKSSSPIYYVKPGDPPFFIAHGDADTLVPVAQSVALDAALAKAGVPHELIIVKNSGHNFTPMPGTTIDPSRDAIYRALFEFLAKYLKQP